MPILRKQTGSLPIRLKSVAKQDLDVLFQKGVDDRPVLGAKASTCY